VFSLLGLSLSVPSNGVSMSPRSLFLHTYPLPAITASREGNQMRFIFQDSDSTLWLGGIHGLIAVEGLDTDHQSCRWYKMNDKQWPIPHHSIRCMFEDSARRLWVGIDGALLLYDRRSHQFRPLHIDGDRRNWVYDIQETTDGKLRVTTYQATYTVSPDRITADGVVAVLQRENAQPYTPQGLSATTPSGTWRVTDEGLCITDARQQVLTSFSTADSYTSVYYHPASQTVWLGGIDKFAAVRADALRSQQQAATPVVTNVEVMGQGYCDALQLHRRHLLLSEAQNCLLFYLSDYEYGTEKAAHFAFRVEGLQEEWVQLPVGSSTLLLSGLQPGSYTLYLSDARQHNDAYSLHFRITPPWYRSRLAWTLYVLLVMVLLALVGLYVRSRRILRRERREKELILQNARSKEEQLSEDKAMLEQELRLSMLAASGDDTQLSQDDQLLLRITHIIEENIDNSDLSVDMLSQLSGIGTKQLYRKIKQLTGRTAVAYIRHLRLQKAARLLASKESFSTKEVMYLTGFQNASYFTRCFQEEFGATPSNYAKTGGGD
jgi:AraC-like DNA-binding protein